MIINYWCYSGSVGRWLDCSETFGQPLQQYVRAESLQVGKLFSSTFKNTNNEISELLSPTVKSKLIMSPEKLVCLKQKLRRNCLKWFLTKSSLEFWIKRLEFSSFSHQNQGRGLMNYLNSKQTLIYYNFRDKTFDDVIETVSAMNAVVDRLYHSAQKLTWIININY